MVHCSHRTQPSCLCHRDLKLRLDQLDAAGTVIGKSDESYVLSTTHPALEPGESRSVVFLSYQTEQPASIQVTVVDAR